MKTATTLRVIETVFFIVTNIVAVIFLPDASLMAFQSDKELYIKGLIAMARIAVTYISMFVFARLWFMQFKDVVGVWLDTHVFEEIH
jgi:hypothetical protein